MPLRNFTDPRYTIPALETGYELDAARGWFSLIMPEASTNLCQNPSFEVNTTGWGTVYGTLTRTSAMQRWGTYSGNLAPTANGADGVYYGAGTSYLVPTVAGQPYTASLYFYAVGGQSYALYWADASGNLVGGRKTFYANPGWQRVSVSFYETQTSLGRRVYLGLAMILKSARLREASAITMQLAHSLQVPLRTLQRWRQWWQDQFPVSGLWQSMCARFLPPGPGTSSSSP